MSYKPKRMELWVSNLLWEKGIRKEEDLNIRTLSQSFGVLVYYIDEDIDAVLFKGKKGNIIFINQNQDYETQYFQFLHELSHLVQDHICHKYLDCHQYNYVELKADYLVKYIAMPYFLIRKKKLDVVEISHDFHLSNTLVKKRLEEITYQFI